MNNVYQQPQGRGAQGASTAVSFPISSSYAPSPQQQQQQQQQQQADLPDLQSLQAGAQLVDRELSHDERRVDVLDSIDTRDSGHYRYADEQMMLTRQMAMPKAIIDQYDSQLHSATLSQHTHSLLPQRPSPPRCLCLCPVPVTAVECNSFVGLLPAINRAYVTVDNRLYLWNLADPSEFYAYTDSQQLIVAVAVVVPKPGIFTAAVPFLLVLTTPVSIHMLAITFANPASTASALTLYPTAFSLPSDNVSMLHVASTRSGRVFLAGKDGHLYELLYHATDSWWRRRMRKLRLSASLSSIPIPLPAFLRDWTERVESLDLLAVDESRSPALLYTLSSSSAISVYALGREDGSARLLSTHRSVWQQARELLYNLHPTTTEDWNDSAAFSITAIHPIPRTESDRIVLTAVTSHGHRLYFTLYDGYYSSLRVKLVRLCPPGLEEPEPERGAGGRRGVSAYDPAWRRGKSVEAVHASLSSAGVLLMADSIPAAGDHLVSVTRDFSPSSNRLIEAVHSSALPSKVADLAEMPPASSSPLAAVLYARGQDMPLAGLSEHASQHVLGPRIFHAVTAVGLLVYSRRRGIDELCDLLMRRRRSLDDEELSQFFHRFGWKEAGAMLLTLACSLPSALALSDGREVEERKEAELLIVSPSKYDHHSVPDDAVIKQAKQTFFRFAASTAAAPAAYLPMLPPAPAPPAAGGSMAYGLTPYIPSVSLSPALSSLLLFISRVLRPMWDWPITVTSLSTNPPSLLLRYSAAQLSEMRGWLQRVGGFMEENRRLLGGKGGEEPEVVERLTALLGISLELVSFLHLLSLHSSLPQLLGSLSPHDAAVLAQSKFYDLITSPQSHLVLKQLMLASSSSASAASSPSRLAFPFLSPAASSWVVSLHEQAPTFFGHSDLLLYKAAQALRAIPSLPDERERATMRDEAMQLCRLAARGGSFSMDTVAAGLREAGMEEGLLELGLYRAELLARREVDAPRGRAAADDEEDWLLAERTKCYQVVLDTLQSVLFPASPLPDPSLPDRLLAVCLSSSDPLFLPQLYGYLIQRQQRGVLLAHPSPQLTGFLSSHDEHALLLRDYYLIHRRHREASLLLHQLAITRSADYGLEDRLGFLSRSLACAREAMEEGGGVTGGGAEADGDYCEALKDRIEVAKLQQKVLARLTAAGGAAASGGEEGRAVRQSVQRLEEELLDVEALYLLSQSFALWDVCLAVFYFSNERGREDVICALWRNVLRGEIVRGRERGGAASGGEQGAGRWESAVEEKLSEMLELYGDVPFMLPLDFIAHELEYNEWKYGTQPTAEAAVAQMLCRAGLQPQRLVPVYERMIGEGGGMEEGMETQVAHSALWLLETVINEEADRESAAAAVRGGGRRRGAGAAAKAVGGASMGLFSLCTRCQECVSALHATRQTELLSRRLAAVQQRISAQLREF